MLWFVAYSDGLLLNHTIIVLPTIDYFFIYTSLGSTHMTSPDNSRQHERSSVMWTVCPCVHMGLYARVSLQHAIRRLGTRFTWSPDVCLRQSRLVIGQFQVRPLKVNIKIFQLGTTLLILGQIMRNFQILIITLLCFESES